MILFLRMERKVNKVGKSSLTVSLPSVWVKKHRIKKGDGMFIEEDGNSLIFSPSKTKPKNKEKEIALATLDYQFTKLTLNNLFRIGYTNVKLQFKSLTQFEEIQKLCNEHLIGFEVTKKEEHCCWVESITEPNGEKSEILLRRIFLIIEESIAVISEDIKTNTFSHLSYLQQQFNKVGQFSNFCLRNVNQHRYSDKMCIEYLFISYLLVLEGELLHLYEHLEGLTSRIEAKKMEELVDHVKEVFHKFSVSFYKKDFGLLAEVNIQAKKLLYEDVYRGLLNYKEESIIFHRLGTFLRTLTCAISPALGLIGC